MEEQFLRSIAPILIRIIKEDLVKLDSNQTSFKELFELQECLSSLDFKADSHEATICQLEKIWRKLFAFIKKYMSDGLNEARDKIK